jgi:hypothetical protein
MVRFLILYFILNMTGFIILPLENTVKNRPVEKKAWFLAFLHSFFSFK